MTNNAPTTYFEVDNLINKLIAENYEKFVTSERKDERTKKTITKLTSIRKELFELLKDEINHHTMDYYGGFQ